MRNYITGGYGVQTVETLINLGYENIHYAEVKHKPSRDRLDGYIKTAQRNNSDGTVVNVDLIPGFFIGSNRGPVLLELQRTVNLGEIIVRSIRTLNELKTFVTVKGSRVADHRRSFHDDSIMGIAIGVYAINYDYHRFIRRDDTSKKMIDVILNINSKKIEEKNKENLLNARKNKQARVYGENSWLFNNLRR